MTRLELVKHLSLEEVGRRFRAAREVVERAHWQVVWLVGQGRSGGEVARITGFLERLVERALAMEGTCTGEHGVGQKKIKYLEAEHGSEALDLMRTLKRAVDPENIMNPGKIVAL
jgi:FAD/FMN-containing dehydrogenase